jgi:hypothetical protein
MRTSQPVFKKILTEHMPANTWVNISEIYALVEKNIGSFQSDDFDPQADYNQQESWKRNLRNVLQREKTSTGILKWDGKANYMLKVSGKKKQKPTGQKSNADLLQGDKLYIQRARQVLPILVRQARAEKTINYSDLAAEVGMPNPRNLNYPLGAIGNALETLAKRTKRKKLPVINCLVVNQRDGLPGEGITWFIDKKDFDKQTKNQKEKTIDRLLANIYAYPDWYWVLDQLGLEPATTDYQEKLKPKIKKGVKRKGGRGGGESQQHLKFKNYIAKHPDLFGLPPDLKGQTEYELPSMDTVDVLFTKGDERIGIEVKSTISDISDISRGLFQCVKYKALIEAEQKANDDIPNCRVALALEGQLPKELIGLKNQLGIEVFEKKKK